MTKGINAGIGDLLLKLVTDVPNYPKPGVTFKDITPLLRSKHFPEIVASLADEIRDLEIEAIAGVESRGFILGAAVAHELNVGFVPLRKKGKLPPPVVSQSYQLEYGEDTLEAKAGSGPVVVLDDVLATGGTLKASGDLLKAAGYDVVGFCVLINLTQLNRFQWNGLVANSLLKL